MTSDDDRLIQVLNAYGADPDRWPEADRLRLAGRVVAEAPALKQAQAIDAVLALASRPAPHPNMAADLVARFQREPQAGVVLPFRAQPQRPPAYRPWAVAGLLAASLSFGIYLGAADPIGFTENTLANLDDPIDLIGLGDAVSLIESSSS